MMSSEMLGLIHSTQPTEMHIVGEIMFQTFNAMFTLEEAK